ncbi:hypothetical protein [Bacillus sp. 0102A]|uniref:hypothetical protein n=1 Tax=Bacillus sp. 0102A TaxID=3120563 RepID=UPI002FD9C15E
MVAIYKASPFYSVSGDKDITFDFKGIYKTEDPDVIKQLNELCPRWVTCVELNEEEPEESKPAPKKQPRKSSAK